MICVLFILVHKSKLAKSSPKCLCSSSSPCSSLAPFQSSIPSQCFTLKSHMFLRSIVLLSIIKRQKCSAKSCRSFQCSLSNMQWYLIYVLRSTHCFVEEYLSSKRSRQNTLKKWWCMWVFGKCWVTRFILICFSFLQW